MRTQSLCVHLSSAGCGLLPGGALALSCLLHTWTLHTVSPPLLPTLPLLSFTPCPHLGPGTELLRRACPGGMRTWMNFSVRQLTLTWR